MTRCTLTGFVSSARSVRVIYILGTMIILSAVHVRSDQQDLSTKNSIRNIHMAHGEDSMSRHIMWNTEIAMLTQIWYGLQPDALYIHQTGISKQITNLDNNNTYIHHTHLWELKHNTTYYWKVYGDDMIHMFKTDGGDESYSTYLYADPSPSSITHHAISNEVKSTSTVIHIGDIDTQNENFLNGIESVASHVPYMMGWGEHAVNNPWIENFWMPENDGINRLWYSWNTHGIHYITLPSTLLNNKTIGPSILEWLQQDIIHASHPNVRQFYPFLCLYVATPIHQYDIMMEYLLPYIQHIDILITVHDAPYERKHINGIHITLDTHVRDGKQDTDVIPSYGMLHAVNSTHMQYQQIASTTGVVLDEAWFSANLTRAA